MEVSVDAGVKIMEYPLSSSDAFMQFWLDVDTELDGFYDYQTVEISVKHLFKCSVESEP